MRAAYDSASAMATDVTPVVVLEAGGPMPDGSTIDAEGGLWSAEWGGSVVRRYDPDGQLTDTIAIPEPHVTCPTFGGPALDDLLVTTARMGLSEADLTRFPGAGATYRAPRTGHRGIADTRVDDTAPR
jgi:L-arabinonolactonase